MTEESVPPNNDPVTREELRTMKEDELLFFIEDTVEQLNKLGDRLETYARETRISKEEPRDNRVEPVTERGSESDDRS